MNESENKAGTENLIVVDGVQIPELCRKGFHQIDITIPSEESLENLSRIREEYRKFYDAVFVSTKTKTFNLFVRGAIFSKQYLLLKNYQLWQGYNQNNQNNEINTTELIDKLVEERRQGISGLLVCEEDKKVYVLEEKIREEKAKTEK